MEHNQTIQLKSIYPHSHISIYEAPMLVQQAQTSNQCGQLLQIQITTPSQLSLGSKNDFNCDLRSSNNNVSGASSCISIINSTSNQILHNATNQGNQQSHVIRDGKTLSLTLLPDSNSSFNQSNLMSSSSCSSSSVSNVTTASALSDILGSDALGVGEFASASNSNSLAALENDKGDMNTKSASIGLTDANLNNSTGSSSRMSSSANSPIVGKQLKAAKTPASFRCPDCNRSFTQKGNLKTHLMTHSGHRPYVCRTCDKSFTQKGNLDTHVKIHTETKDHKCQFCDKGFTQRGNLKTHIRSIHTKEKPFSCSHCGKAFSQKGNMLTHWKTHDKDTRFPCSICGKTFSQKGNLKTHQQRHIKMS